MLVRCNGHVVWNSIHMELSAAHSHVIFTDFTRCA